MKHALCVFAASTALMASTTLAIAAESMPDPAAKAAEGSMDRGLDRAAVRPRVVEITGSNIKRAEGEGLSSPVKVITREEIEKAGPTDIRTVLRRYQ